MKLIFAFLRLIRWPNLLFIILTQSLFYYCIVLRIRIPTIHSTFSFSSLIYLITASVLIAAAGYIINDYFDINIDQVNKPGKRVVEKIINRRWAMLLHIVLSASGVGLCLYIDLTSPGFWLGITNLICVLLLFGYSVNLKSKFLVGNVLIAALTAWVIIVVYLCYYHSFYRTGNSDTLDPNINNRLTRMAMLYAGFAFIISLIREVIKDMEDMEGDAKYNCKTMPIKWGIPASKVFVAVWVIVLICTLGIVQFYVLQSGWWLSALYCLLFIILPLLWVLRNLYLAQTTKDYHRLSTAIKLIMFTGILSMLFFKYYS